MVNAVKRFFDTSVDDEKVAIVFFDGIKSLKNPKKTISFGEIKKLSIKYQAYLDSLNLTKEDSILLFEEPSPKLFALMIAIMASGHQVLVIEPWLPLENIKHIIEKVKPKVFIAKNIGKFWGLRSKGIRGIKHWSSTSIINKNTYNKKDIFINDVAPDHHAVLTFTSGTSGKPKGVFRKHEFLITASDTIKKYLQYDKYPGTDLTIFTNLVLGNLGLGKGSILIPSKWPRKALKDLDLIPKELAPDTMSCGPGFLRIIMKEAKLKYMKSIHLGGALTDCAILEKAFKHFPNAHIDHVYGSSEAEPVAAIDARDAVKLSREKGYFQCLTLGKSVQEISKDFKNEILWVAGAHVSPMYIDDDNANKKNKYKDEQGVIWHNMGDRIKEIDSILWYDGRDFQTKEEFKLEQQVYSFLQSSKAMIYQENEKFNLIHEDKIDTIKLRKEFSQLAIIKRSKIYRDIRHRARIDRNKTIKKS